MSAPTRSIADTRLSTVSHWKCVAIYCAISFGFSWVAWLPSILGKEGLGWLSIDPFMPVVISVGTLGPLLAGYVAHRLETGNWHAVHFFPKRRIRLLWWVGGPALVFLVWFVFFPALISKGSPRTWHWHAGALAGILVPMFNYNLFAGPLFEEFGWRGFLQPRLQRRLPPWIAAVVVGLTWSAWHLTLFLIRGWTSASLPVFAGILIGLSMAMAFAFNSSDRVVVVAVLMHAAFNASPRFLGRYLDGTQARDGGFFMPAAFLFVGIAISILTRGRLGAHRTAMSSS